MQRGSAALLSNLGTECVDRKAVNLPRSVPKWMPAGIERRVVRRGSVYAVHFYQVSCLGSQHTTRGSSTNKERGMIYGSRSFSPCNAPTRYF